MDPNSQPDRNAFTATTGFEMQAMSDAYIPLAVDVATIVNTRLNTVPWLPADVTGKIDDWIGRQVNGTYWIAVPVSSPVNRPAFLNTPEKIAWWDDLTKVVQRARLAYGAKKLTEGRAVMQTATDNIAFWDRAISIARVLAAPVTAVESGITQFMSSTTFKFALLAGAGYLTYLYLSRRPAVKANPPRRKRRTA